MSILQFGFVAAVYIAFVLCIVYIAIQFKRRKSSKTVEPIELEFTPADEKRLLQGLFNRYPLDYEFVLKAYGPEDFRRFFEPVFDMNGDVIELKNRDCKFLGFVSSLADLDGWLNSPTMLRERLGMNHPNYDAKYGGDIYVVTADLSDQNLRFDVPVNETAGGLALFQEGGLTAGKAREVQIANDGIPVYEKIVEIRRVCEKGYGRPFTPNESFKHAILNYFRGNPTTDQIEPWDPWLDKEDSAWAVPLIRIKTE
jgi:hypothetical protein